MTSLIFALWSIGFAAKALAVFVLWRRGLASRFQSLTALLIVLTAQTVIAAALSHDMQAYTRAYALIAWASILFEGFAITGVFWILTEHYPRYRTAGSVLLAILSIAATAILLGLEVTSSRHSGWQGLWHSRYLGATRHERGDGRDPARSQAVRSACSFDPRRQERTTRG